MGDNKATTASTVEFGSPVQGVHGSPPSRRNGDVLDAAGMIVNTASWRGKRVGQEERIGANKREVLHVHVLNPIERHHSH